MNAIVTEFRRRFYAATETPEPTAAPINRGTPNPPRRGKDLGPNQLAWLRDKVGPFEVCERLVLASGQHRREMLGKVRP